MRKGDVICPECGAGFRRIELGSRRRTVGEFRCPRCGRVVKLAQLPAAGGAHDHQCFGCEKFDPLKSELVTGWLNGELGRPKRTFGSSPTAGSLPIAEDVK